MNASTESGVVQELEFKFSLADDTLPSYEELQATLQPLHLSLALPESYQQHDRYFDSKKRLAKAGIALRQRVRNGQNQTTLTEVTHREATLKSVMPHSTTSGESPIAGEHHFKELTVSLPLVASEEQTQKWHPKIREALRGIAFTSRLQPILELNTHRISYAIASKGQPFATLCFDEVSATLPDQPISAHFMECELEFLHTQQRHIDKWAQPIIEALHKVVAMNPTSSHKVARAQTLLAHSHMMDYLDV